MQISAFDTIPFIMMTQNPDYYPQLIEQAGYAKAKDLYAWLLTPDAKFDPRLVKASERAAKRSGIEIRDIDLKNFESEIENILTIYNDGITPGPVRWIHPVGDNTDMARMVVYDFLQWPELRAATPAIVNALVRYYKTLLRFNNQVLPEAIPDPNDIALQSVGVEGTLPPSGSLPGLPALANA